MQPGCSSANRRRQDWQRWTWDLRQSAPRSIQESHTPASPRHVTECNVRCLSKQFVAAVDLASQRQLAGRIERLLLDETPIIYPYFYDYLTATQKTVTGVYPTAIGELFLWNAAKT